MSFRGLHGHKNLRAMEFKGKQPYEPLRECADWLEVADNFDNYYSVISVNHFYDCETAEWLVFLVYDDMGQDA